MGLTTSRTRNPTMSTPAAAKGERPAANAPKNPETPSTADNRRVKGSPSQPQATPARGDATTLAGGSVSLGSKAQDAAKKAVAATGVWRPFNWSLRKAETKVQQMTRSPRFKRHVDEAFDECDLHHDGKIPASELYVAILLLYHRINAMPLGGGLKKPPNRDEVLAAMARHDKGKKGFLTREEFHICAEEMCPQIARGISRQLLTVMVATPLVAKSLWHAIDVILGRLWPKAAAFAHKWLALPFDILLIPTIAAAVVPILFASYDGTQGESYAAAAKKGA